MNIYQAVIITLFIPNSACLFYLLFLIASVQQEIGNKLRNEPHYSTTYRFGYQTSSYVRKSQVSRRGHLVLAHDFAVRLLSHHPVSNVFDKPVQRKSGKQRHVQVGHF
jgi:hypothetical protein